MQTIPPKPGEYQEQLEGTTWPNHYNFVIDSRHCKQDLVKDFITVTPLL